MILRYVRKCLVKNIERSVIVLRVRALFTQLFTHDRGNLAPTSVANGTLAIQDH